MKAQRRITTVGVVTLIAGLTSALSATAGQAGDGKDRRGAGELSAQLDDGHRQQRLPGHLGDVLVGEVTPETRPSLNSIGVFPTTTSSGEGEHISPVTLGSGQNCPVQISSSGVIECWPASRRYWFACLSSHLGST